jgi:tetratricopeptide (TPR) repeat protein
MLHGRCGDLDRARELLASARSHHVRLGDRRAQTAALLNESFVALWQGDAGAAKELATAALAEAQAMDHAAYTAQAHGNLGAALRDLGDAEAGLAHMEAGLAIQLPLGRLADAVSDLADAALTRATLGDLPGAQALAEQILALDPSWSDAAIFPPFPAWVAACILHWSGDPRAGEVLTSALRLATAFAASIDVPELRARFESLPFVAAGRSAEAGRWPPAPARRTPGARRGRTVEA